MRSHRPARPQGRGEAKHKLARHNLAFVVFVARKQRRGGVRLKDLIQEGNAGLMRAVEKFDPQVGTRFSTCADTNLAEATGGISEALERKETGRIEAFSDGVFAIAITLLVLTIKAPVPSELAAGGLGRALLALWPHYLAFVTSFAIILDMWVNHHRIFTLVRRSDHVFLYWNGLLLLLITFLPFPTTLVAEYMLHPETRVAGAVFTGSVLAIALMFKGLWRYAAREGRLLARNADPANIKQVTNQHRYGPIMYLGAFVLSFVSTGASVALCLGLAVFLGFKGWPTRGR